MPERIQYRLLPDGKPPGILGRGEKRRPLLVQHARIGPLAAAPLLDDDAPFLVDLQVVKTHAVRPVLEDLQGRLHNLRRVRGYAEFVYSLIETGVGVEVGAKTQAHPFEIVLQFVLGEVARAIEGHMLDEVRQALLLIGLQDRSHVQSQAQLRALLRLGICPDDIAHAVVEDTGHHGRIDGELAISVAGICRRPARFRHRSWGPGCTAAQARNEQDEGESAET